jgi:hypothetical protein
MRNTLIHVNRRSAFPALQAKPRKIPILAGQPNMPGHAMIRTFAESTHNMMPGEGRR